MPCVSPDPCVLVLPCCQAEGGTVDASPGSPLRRVWPTRGGSLVSSWKPGLLGMKEIKGRKELRRFPPCSGTAEEPLEVIGAGVSLCRPGPRAAWCPPPHPRVPPLLLPLAGPVPAQEAGLSQSTLHTQDSAVTAATSDGLASCLPSFSGRPQLLLQLACKCANAAMPAQWVLDK